MHLPARHVLRKTQLLIPLPWYVLRLRLKVMLLNLGGLLRHGVHAREGGEHCHFQPLETVRGTRLVVVVVLRTRGAGFEVAKLVSLTVPLLRKVVPYSERQPRQTAVVTVNRNTVRTRQSQKNALVANQSEGASNGIRLLLIARRSLA